MNRYQIESDRYEVWCGWDNRMNTLFGHVFNKASSSEEDDDEDDHIARIVGSSRDEIKTVEELQELLPPCVTIPENIRSLLRIDMIEATPQTELHETARKTARGGQL